MVLETEGLALQKQVDRGQFVVGRLVRLGRGLDLLDQLLALGFPRLANPQGRGDFAGRRIGPLARRSDVLLGLIDEDDLFANVLLLPQRSAEHANRGTVFTNSPAGVFLGSSARRDGAAGRSRAPPGRSPNPDHVAAESQKRKNEQPAGEPQQQVVGGKKHPDARRADHQDIRPHAGEIHLEHSASGSAQVSAGADHRAGRQLRHGHARQGAEAGQRKQPARKPHQGLRDRVARKQRGREHGHRTENVVGANAECRQQHVADDRARVTAEVVDRLGTRIDKPARRVLGRIAQQRSRQKHGQRKQSESQQVDFEVAFLEHGQALGHPAAKLAQVLAAPPFPGASVPWPFTIIR